MKNTKIWLVAVLFAVFSAAAFAQDAKIYSVVAQNFLKDKNDFLRYSPMNMFDDESSTVFAVTYGEINSAKPVFEIYFYEPLHFDSMRIKAGYFDARYFERNNRIKQLKLSVLNSKPWK